MKAMLLVLLFALGMPPAAFADTTGEVKEGAYLRNETLNGFNGDKKKFSDYKGKPLIINVWASWCTPCREEMASLDRLARRYSGKQLNIIGISTDDYKDAAELFIKQSKLSFTNYLDHDVILENMLGANAIPLTVFVDAKGRVLYKAHGAYEWDMPDNIDAMAELFGIKLPH